MALPLVLLLAVLAGFAYPTAAHAQERVPLPDVTASLAEGWTLLAKGDAAGAARIARQALAQDARDTAALALAVDAELAGAGPTAALGAYEAWLGDRRLEAAHVLRRVARAMLVEASGTQGDARARVDALAALAADGDGTAAATLERAATGTTGFVEARALAANGNPRAIKTLIAQLHTIPGSKTSVIDALGDSRNPIAVPPLRALLSDPSDINRAAAADALGRLDAREAIPELRTLLNDRFFTVKLKAAGALWRMEDGSGLSLLTDLSHSEHAAVRAAAARELAAQPDATWQALVRSLANDPDPAVRLEAARLIAPYDQPLARSILDRLMRDDNVGIRQAASGVLVDRVAADFATLRALLRQPDATVRVQAASRILELTR
jgi:hypothetical protein